MCLTWDVVRLRTREVSLATFPLFLVFLRAAGLIIGASSSSEAKLIVGGAGPFCLGRGKTPVPAARATLWGAVRSCRDIAGVMPATRLACARAAAFLPLPLTRGVDEGLPDREAMRSLQVVRTNDSDYERSTYPGDAKSTRCNS